MITKDTLTIDIVDTLTYYYNFVNLMLPTLYCHVGGYSIVNRPFYSYFSTICLNSIIPINRLLNLLQL